MPVEELVVLILDRPRHQELIAAVRKAGARIRLISDGDVAGVIATARPDTGIDIYMGSGGAPEGVLAAAALRCIGGQFQGRLMFRNDDERARARKMGVDRPRPDLRPGGAGPGRRDVRRHRRHRRHHAQGRAPRRRPRVHRIDRDALARPARCGSSRPSTTCRSRSGVVPHFARLSRGHGGRSAASLGPSLAAAAPATTALALAHQPAARSRRDHRPGAGRPRHRARRGRAGFLAAAAARLAARSVAPARPRPCRGPAGGGRRCRRAGRPDRRLRRRRRHLDGPGRPLSCAPGRRRRGRDPGPARRRLRPQPGGLRPAGRRRLPARADARQRHHRLRGAGPRRRARARGGRGRPPRRRGRAAGGAGAWSTRTGSDQASAAQAPGRGRRHVRARWWRSAASCAQRGYFAGRAEPVAARAGSISWRSARSATSSRSPASTGPSSTRA